MLRVIIQWQCLIEIILLKSLLNQRQCCLLLQNKITHHEGVFYPLTLFSLGAVKCSKSVDIEHFTAPNLKKSSWITYPLIVGNFILKKEATLPLIEHILKQYNFNQALPLNYDPQHIISQRRVENDRGPFQHSQIPDLIKDANSLLYDCVWKLQPIIESTQVGGDTGNSQSEPTTETSVTKKRTMSDVSEMDTE